MSAVSSPRASGAVVTSQALCEAIARWRFEDLPRTVVSTLKSLLLDEVGVIAGAANAPGIAELNARLGRWEAGGSATGLIGKRRYSPPSAALANGTAGHALDYDDQHDPARVHTNCVVLPTLLAAAEDAGPIDGRQFLLGYAVGAELHARFGLACYNSLGKGWHPTMVFGTLAAALGAGRMLGLNVEGLGNALGMAYHQTSGSAQSMRDGVLSKRLGAGFAARAAVLGTFLALDGLTGTRRTLEGNAGLFALYERGEVRPELLADDLGSRWRIAEYSLKPYPCCRCNHSAIDLGIRLHQQGIRPEQVDAIEIGMGHVNWLTVGEAYDPGRNEIVHAQFNAAYGFARALADGRVDLRTYTRPAITDPRVSALTAITRVVDDPHIDPNAIEPVRIRLTLKGGDHVDVSATTVKGGPQDPMSAAERMAKFYDCLEFGLGADRAQADCLAEALDAIEQQSDAARAIVEAFPQARAR